MRNSKKTQYFYVFACNGKKINKYNYVSRLIFINFPKYFIYTQNIWFMMALRKMSHPLVHHAFKDI